MSPVHVPNEEQGLPPAPPSLKALWWSVSVRCSMAILAAAACPDILLLHFAILVSNVDLETVLKSLGYFEKLFQTVKLKDTALLFALCLGLFLMISCSEQIVTKNKDQQKKIV